METSLFQAAFQGLLNIMQLKVFLAMLLGVSIGTFTAVAPQGIGMPLVYAMLLPVVIKWEPMTGMAILIGASSVSAICAAYLPILFGIPGGSGSQATVLDGYPMGKRGEARRALGASFMAGGMGCLIGTATLMVAIPLARPLIYLMGSPELFVVMLWGLSMIAVLAGRRPIKGLIAAAFGLLLATVGQQAQSGVMRFVFNQPYLLDGISISIIALALFGIPSALDLALTKLGVEQQPAPLKGSLREGIKDTVREWWLVVRCSFVGIWVGIVPGLGSQVVDWLAYGHAAQSCKGGKESFGKGDVRGVIAPESANDAKDGGDLITTLLLGFPQGVVTALFIVALLAWGYLPGPEMVKKNADVIYSIIWIQGSSGIIGALIGFVLANELAKLAEVRYSFMVPMILIFVLMGAFGTNRDPVDLLVVVSFGILGYFMKRFAYPRPALILGLVLGDLMEKYLYRSMMSYGFSWLARPSVSVLLILTAVSLFFTLRGRFEKKAEARPVSGGRLIELKLPANLTPFFIAVFLVATLVGWEWPYIAKLMPVYVAAIPGLLLGCVQLSRDATGWEARQGGGKGEIEMDEVFMTGLDARTEIQRTVIFFAWFIGGALAIWLLGIVVALPLLALFYALVDGREKWTGSLLMTGGTFLFIWGLFEYLFEMRWPPGALFR